MATAAKRATDAAAKATEAAEATKAGAAEVATAGKRALSQAITATEKRADERASAAEDARAARIDKQLAAAARLDDRTMWVGLGHGLAAVATVGVTLAGFWMTLAFAVWGWRWAMNAEGWARGLTFVGLIAATAGIVIACYHSWSWLAPRVQVAIDAYDKRNRKK
ncbi:hypothetical protein [Gordonia spumicola]|uniref:hypothetical protein n=1 Tax=Gordonia spumicola TaxID=589161 RepID=UPI0013796C47|nr:hypothetical protein [Gordonia spumicola]